ncbi:MAG: response regulator [Polyangiaceae bacterium]|nr:response regulator [Polyangiaceae bacterium]
MTRRHRQTLTSGRVILLADDDAEYLEATRLLLAAEGHQVLTASSGPAALALLREGTVDVFLLDYFMPGMTGEEVVARLREFDPNVQVVLQTGYSEEQPPRSLLQRLDIQGYYDKSEGPERLLLWTDAALKASRVITRLSRSTAALQILADATPRLHSGLPLPRLLTVILDEASSLVERLRPRPRGDPSPPVPPGALVGLFTEGTHLVAAAGRGPFAGAPPDRSSLPAALVTTLAEVARRGEPRSSDTGSVVPLRTANRPLGALFVESRLGRPELELLRLFADHAAIAIDSARRQRHIDPKRAPVEVLRTRILEREVRTAIRSSLPLSVALLASEPGPALESSARAGTLALLEESLRFGDLVLDADAEGRFTLVMPATAGRGAARFLRRVLSALPTGAERSSLRWRAGLACLATHRWPAEAAHPTRSIIADRTAELLGQAGQALIAAAPRAGVPLVLAPSD